MEAFYALKMLGEGGIQKIADIEPLSFFIILAASLVSSLYLSHVYEQYNGRDGLSPSIYRSFPLIGAATTGIFITLQFSLPLSLGMLGALSIVRFRTPMKNPEDVGFFLIVIACSITCATYNMPFLFIVLLCATAALGVMRSNKLLRPVACAERLMIVRMPSNVYSDFYQAILKLIKEEPSRFSLNSFTEEQNTCSLTFKARTSSSESLQAKLQALSKDISVSCPQ